MTSPREPGFHKPRRRLRTALVAALLLPALAGDVSAASVRRMTLPEVVAASETIVLGRVESVRSAWEGAQIVTEVRLRVTRSLKGSGVPDRGLGFIQLGGRVSSPVPMEMAVPGAPVHRVGDEGFYFLEAGAAERPVIVGLFRGHVPIRRGPQGDYVVFDGMRRAPAEFADAILAAIAGQPSRGTRSAP